MKNEKRITLKCHQKPETCPQCGGKVVEIIYGEPTQETFEMAERSEVMLGGCILTEDAPDWQCTKCGQHYMQD